MKFEYTYKITTFELWQLSMYYIYGSLVGVCNLIFTVAIFVLAAAKWSTSSHVLQILMVLGCCLFTVIQPILIYWKAKKQASGMKDTRAGFDDNGIHITVENQKSDIKWSSIKKISRKPTLVILFSDTTHGFVLTNRVLGNTKNDFLSYITSKMNA